MKSKTTIGVQQSNLGATKRAPQNIDGFFRSRTTVSGRVVTPPISDTITQLVPSKPAKPAPARSLNHAKAHLPQPAKTSTIRVHSGVQHSQKLTVHRSPANVNHAKAHQLQSSQTLMRAAVKRPQPSFRKQAGTVAALQHSVPSLIVPKKSVMTLDEQRLVRAKTTNRSPLIAHHSTPKPRLLPTVRPLPVTPQPVRPPEQGMPPTPPSPMPTNKPTDIFEHALMNASHYVDTRVHHRTYRKQVRTHVASMLAGSMVLIAIASFVAYQNSPALQFKLASINAGVSARMPDLSSIGYSFNGVKSQGGKLVVGLKKGDARYQVTQQATNLSSDDMIQNIGATDASGTPDYKAISAGSTTIYRFGNTAATWIQNGKWYTLTGTGALTDSQLTSLARNI